MLQKVTAFFKHFTSLQKKLIAINILVVFLIFALAFQIHKLSKPSIPQSVLAPHIHMGLLTLNVSNFSEMEKFYELLGLQVLVKDSSSVILGSNNSGVIRLVNTPNLPPPNVNPLGLSQIAIVYKSKPQLAKAIQNVIKSYPMYFQGGTDRVISQSFYVYDPQGNVLELYFDTDPSTWTRLNGKVLANQLPLDVNQFISQYAKQTGDTGISIGHLQIKTGEITTAKKFYVDTIGFYVAQQPLGTESLFMSDGFYHHDLVVNEVEGVKTQPKTQGLARFTIDLPNSTYVEKLAQRLQKANVQYTEVNGSLSFSDPWGTHIAVDSNGSWLDNFIAAIPH